MPNMDTRNGSDDAATRHREHRVEELIARLPYRLGTTARWLRRPSSRWFRIPAGALLIGGSFFSILPVFGIWMLPLGLILLAQDVAPLRRARDRILDWVERRRPQWFTTNERASLLLSPSPSSRSACTPPTTGRHR